MAGMGILVTVAHQLNHTGLLVLGWQWNQQSS
jgi:hypothetical protein